MSTHNTVMIKGRGKESRREAVAAGAITPGHLVAYNTLGKVVVHPTAAGNAAALFAVENEVFGTDLTVAYATNDNVLFHHCGPGDEVNALVAAAAAAIVVGDYLESAGNGTLRKVTTAAATADTQRHGVIALALEAVDNSGGGVSVRLRAAIL